MRRISAKAPALACALLMCQMNGLANQELARVRVTILDQTDARVVGAVVAIIKNETVIKNLYTNGLNESEIELPPGIYRLKVDASGFKAYEDGNLTVEVGRLNELTIRLIGAPIGGGCPVGEWQPVEVQKAPLVEKIKAIRW
jgi:hypothetical protein